MLAWICSRLRHRITGPHCKCHCLCNAQPMWLSELWAELEQRTDLGLFEGVREPVGR